LYGLKSKSASSSSSVSPFLRFFGVDFLPFDGPAGTGVVMAAALPRRERVTGASGVSGVVSSVASGVADACNAAAASASCTRR